MSYFNNSKDLDEATRQKFRLEEREVSVKDIPLFFESAIFQRDRNATHVLQIEKAILENKMYDNVITLFTLVGKMKVLDGQHRLTAYHQIYEKTGLFDTIRLVLRHVEAADEKEAREIYQRLNSGKSLDVSDILKKMDDGTYRFFDGLRKTCSHTKKRNLLSYRDAFIMIGSSHVSGNRVRCGIPQVKGILDTVTNNDIVYVKKFMDVLTSLESKGLFKHSRLMVATYVLCFKKDFDAVDFAIKLPKIADSDRIARFIAKYGFAIEHNPAFYKLLESELLS